ncbi:high nitrogen upregulated cytochrome P450 monooxygenase 2 [Fomitiporia mediterranea MF3/22]|uniref:high nitrogen upregulated cytochrome P450 monooxygenase 2 n=1 Tax=Fomitiporia mediterranea (strain MF3/22) TaxID=694068 RepID=UPI0004407719|nr:high nitrogen upregulated cytochrome P450 monooxygenase 2 [Fomitiporia mediterranea MF3/22]EJD05634.1 high nitrogen upregulated cytochrome P450 monooxygenase 2 [Fomitiporia mediterranea MF3/22]
MFLPSEYYTNAMNSLPVLDLRDALLFAVGGGLVTHLIYKKYEVQPSSYIPTFLLLIATPFICSSFLPPHFSSTTNAYIAGFGTFYSSLLASIACYRLSPWHPLAKYPGPILAKLSKFWIIYIILKGDQLRVVTELHKKYGPYVRLGPNELSFADADLLPVLLAPDMPRGPMWDGRRNPDAPPNLIATRSSADHARKRVPWTHAFSTASVREYQPAITRRAGQLAEELEKRALSGETVNLVTWMTYFAFDFMGDMAFGGGFELMRNGDVNGLWKMMVDRIDAIGWQMHIPWATRLLLKVPFATEAVVKFRNFTIQCAAQRKMKGSHVKDLFYHLINEGHEEPNASKLSEVVVSGELAIVAGSDTTSTTLSGVFFYLLTNPEYYARLREEVDAYFPLGEGEPFDGTRLAEMKYLNAVINETLRIQPAVPTGIQRAPEKGTGGKWIGKHFLSEGTAVNIPPYVLHHNPQYFSPAPDSFWPDRWLRNTKSQSGDQEKVEITHNISAFIPFSAGHANCAGKNLALAEMRVVVALLMQKFDLRLAPDYDPSRWEKDMIDLFVVKPGDLPVIITLRA